MKTEITCVKTMRKGMRKLTIPNKCNWFDVFV